MKDLSVPVFYDQKAVKSTQYANALQGIKGAAARYGQHICLIAAEEIGNFDFDTLPDAAIVLSISMPFIERILGVLREKNRRAVLAGIDSGQFGADVSCATPSRHEETEQLVNYLYNCGRERIALVGFGTDSINDNIRYHAAVAAATVYGMRIGEGDVWQWQHDPHECFDAFLARHEAYDAVICPNDIIAICLINECRKRGIGIPQKLYLASFGNMSVGRYSHPSVTSVSMDMLSVGAQAYNVWRLLMGSAGQEHPSIRITVPGKILARESTAGAQPRTGFRAASARLQADRFYDHPVISSVVGLDNCISQRDALDMRLIRSVMDGDKYEAICEKYYLSASALRYRLKRIFSDAGVSSRKEFESLIHRHLGEGNPFDYVK